MPDNASTQAQVSKQWAYKKPSINEAIGGELLIPKTDHEALLQTLRACHSSPTIAHAEVDLARLCPLQTHPQKADMKISVVTAVFNRESTIGPAIKSVQDQDYPQLEHIIQDGGSTDGTLPIVHRLANTATHVFSESDAGIYDALNRGIARATGDIIGVMHSDDIFASHQVLSKISHAFADPQIDGVYGDLTYVAAQDPTKVIRYWKSGPYHQAELVRGWMPPHPTLYLRRHVFERWGTYDTNFQIAADYDAMLRYLIKGQIQLAYIPDVFVRMRVGGESNKSLSRMIRKSQEDYRALKRNGVGGLGTLALKNIRKARQFFQRQRINT